MPLQIETLKPAEIAQALRVHPFTVTRLAREGKLPGFKVGGIWRFRKDELEQWLESNRRMKVEKRPSSRPKRKKVRV